VTRIAALRTYQVGGRWTFVPFGRDPITTRRVEPSADANYGVVYDVDAETSTTDVRVRTEVVFDPSAGVARGRFCLREDDVDEPSHPTAGICWELTPLAPADKRQITS